MVHGTKDYIYIYTVFKQISHILNYYIDIEIDIDVV